MADSAATAPVLAAFQGVAASLPHDSAVRHVSGSAVYIDDLPEPAGMLHVHLGMSAKAHARITRMDLSAVRAAPGVVLVLSAEDIPGENDVSPVIKDDKLFAASEAFGGEVYCVGQSLFAVAATSIVAARAAAALAVVDYEDLPAALDIAAARDADLKIEASQRMARGDAAAALAASPRRLQGQFAIGGQDHFYLEGQVALATPREEGDRRHAPARAPWHPSEVHEHHRATSRAVPTAVTVRVRRMRRLRPAPCATPPPPWWR